MISGIRLLELQPNARGDLFGRLMRDLFAALGYDKNVWINVPDSGREMDIKAFHRTERKRAVAECKAWRDPVGGDEINKFVGALDAERRETRRGASIVGYFISLSGFKTSALQQEERLGANRLVLMDGKQVAEQLVRGAVIVGPHIAMERAGRCVGRRDLHAEAQCELLGTHGGWIWCVYYTQHGQRSHYSLVDGDGNALSREVALAVCSADHEVGGNLDSLKYLTPDADDAVSREEQEKAKAWYLDYLDAECGGIVLDGLPAEQEVRSRRLRLESLFVPLHVVEHKDAYWEAHRSRDRPVGLKRRRIPFGEVFTGYQRLAVLALPGGGKSTLLKRLAVAYAFPDRRQSIDDLLPDQELFPILVRCRQLGALAAEPISRIIRAIPEKAEMGHLSEAFEAAVRSLLQESKVLLLIDGLDEIAEPGTRAAFVSQLRTFLGRYPGTKTIVTSRPAGFRHVASTVASYCNSFDLAEFDNNDIERLTRSWHAEVVGSSPEIASDAADLAGVICSTDRIRRLATNPLMLTTLLLVKRWVGHLPSLRHELYERTIDVLLITWNVEAHQRLEKDEVIPRLAYVAFSMMQDGVQGISSTRLLRLLTAARAQMPEILEWATLRDPEFVQRVEDRSSLLMMTGRTWERGRTLETYEFRHLTFQEYLAALAVVSGYYPGANVGDTILDIMKPHIGKADWKEVVPLVAVLADRRQVQPLIEHLISICRGKQSGYRAAPEDLLVQCLVDGVQIPRTLLMKALKSVIRYDHDAAVRLYNSKYGEATEEYIRSTLELTKDKPETSLMVAMQHVCALQFGWNPYDVPSLSGDVVERVTGLLSQASVSLQIAGCALIKEIMFKHWTHRETKPDEQKLVAPWGEKLCKLLNSDNQSLIVAASWAMAHLGKAQGWTATANPRLIQRLFQLWTTHRNREVGHYCSFAINALPLARRGEVALPRPTSEQLAFVGETLEHEGEGPYSHSSREAALTIAYYLGTLCDDHTLGAFAADVLTNDFRLTFSGDDERWVMPVAKAVLLQLGDYGRDLIMKVEEAAAKEGWLRNGTANSN